MRRRKKIYYIPGLISLIVIPFIFLHYVPVPKKQVVLKFFLPCDDMNADTRVSVFSKRYILKQIRKKKIVSVDLTEDHEMNSDKLKFIQSEAQRLKFTYDTVHVLKVGLCNETNFSEFVSLLNMMLTDHHKKYAFIDNDFYIFGEPPPEKNYQTLIYGLDNDVVYYEPKKSTWEKAGNWFNQQRMFFRSGWLLIGSLIVFVIIPSIFRYHESNQHIDRHTCC